MPSKVTFDGINKIIYVNTDVTALDIRADVYSSWVNWIVVDDNLKFQAAVRTTGYDPIGVGTYTGDIYFLINGWKLSLNLLQVRVTGVLYSDDYTTAFYTPALAAQYPVTVAALVNTVSTGGAGATAIQIRQEIDNNSTKLAQIKAILDSMVIPTSIQNADAVWDKSITTMTDKTTIGGFITKMVLTIPKFLGLK